MNPATTILGIAILALTLSFPTSLHAADKALNIKVLLQGDSSTALETLVTDNGGTITHRLPIINAVGAMLSEQQLERIKHSPVLKRHLDDLSLNEPPQQDPAPESTEDHCDIGSSIELDLDDGAISWNLYNKQSTPVALLEMQLTWPVALGAATRARLGDTELKLIQKAQQKSGELHAQYATSQYLLPTGKTTLQVSFQQPYQQRGGRPLQQKDFTAELTFTGDCSTSLVPAYANNHEDTYYPAEIGAGQLHTHGVTGRGVTVAIIDSGLWEHPALLNDTKGKNRIIAAYNAITGTEGRSVFDESGHGTHMASILAWSAPVTTGSSPANAYKGVAPDVNLVIVKAFDDEGQGDFLDLVRAIQFVVERKEEFGIKVLNLSFAARPRWSYWEDPVNQAVMQAWAAGITVVAAAGNEGPEPMTIGSPGNLPYVITVGAVTDSWTPGNRDDDYIPDFSSRGPTPDAHIKPDLVAPGGHMTGITRPDSSLAIKYPDYFLSNGDFVMTGSSQASALVSGVVALLLQLEPDLTPDDVKCKLMSSAEPAINADGLLAYSPFSQGSGYVSATRAITLGERGCGNDQFDIQKDIRGDEHFQGPAIVTESGETSLPGLADMVSPIKPTQGMSDSRRWGIKSHVERPDYDWQEPGASQSRPFDWEFLYLQEKERIQSLAQDPKN